MAMTSTTSPTKPRIPLGQAEVLAAELVELFRPYCSRIEIAGSIRRRVSEVDDIEILAVPLPAPPAPAPATLFGDQADVVAVQLDLLSAYCTDLRRQGILEDRLDKNGRPAYGPRFKRLIYKDVPLDLFSVIEPGQWGVLFTIRTGPADFSHQLVTAVGQKFRDHTGALREGWMPSGYYVEDGAVHELDGGKILPMPEEEDLFRFLGREWIRPAERR